MRVAIELTALELDAGGTGRAIECTLPELEALPGLELIKLSHPGTKRNRVLRGLTRELYYLPFALGRAARRSGADLLHCPAPLAPARSPVPMVMTIHDVIAFDHPEWLSRENAVRSKLLLPRALRASARIIVSSEYSRQRIAALLGIDLDAMTVVPLGVDARFAPGPSESGIEERLVGGAPYVLTVGTLQPRKNLEGALQAFEHVASQGAPHHLVVVGARGWGDDAVVRRLAESPFADRVHLCGRVDDDELVDLYRAADCFVFPSRYEGFGLPILEAMACGTPVISSDRTSLPEVAGDAGLLFDPDDQPDFNAKLAEVLDSAARAEDLVARGRAHAAAFTWRRTAEQTAAVYRAVLESVT